MKIFSRALLAFILAATAAPLAKADLTIVSGNVYDVGKYSYSKDQWIEYEGINDSAMCWAAASANVIQYWQDTYYAKHDTGETPANGQVAFGYSSPSGSGCLNVYKQLTTYWSNAGGSSMNAISWWMQGATPGGLGGRYYPSGSALKDQTTGGYYETVFGKNTTTPRYPSLDGAPFFSAKLADSGLEERTPAFSTVESAIMEAFKNDAQAVVLDLKPLTGTGHSITCWGYESVVENGVETITSLILSDSDDKKYGTFIVSLTENSEGFACIGTDRNRSDYHGNHAIMDVVYIKTPDNYSTELKGQAAITALDQGVTSSGKLTASVETSAQVNIGGGNYSGSTVPQAVAFTTAENAHITIHHTAPGTDAQMVIHDGAMALLYGGLTITGNANTTGGGVVADGHLYVHGGDVSITDCSSSGSGGGIYATTIDGEGIYASTYVEMKGAGNINISSNTSSTHDREDLGNGIYSYNNAGGGAICAADSFSVRDSGNVSMNGNKAEGYNVHGGATYSIFNSIISGNGNISVDSNTLTADEGYKSYGGGMAGMYIELDNNGAISFAGNKITVTNSSARGWVGSTDTQNIYESGANAAGGAIAVHPFVDVSYYDWDLTPIGVPTTLTIDGNDSVNFSNNIIKATYSGDASQEPSINDETCSALGGAIYLGNEILENGKASGSVASISRNSGDIVFRGNSATSLSTRHGNDKAQGGAIYISAGTSLTMEQNAGTITFDSNSVTGTTAQGGAIYNEGELSIKGNQDVVFSNNQAVNGEGDHLYNEAGACVEIAGNKSMTFRADSGNSSVVNKGDMYLSSAGKGTITFHNTELAVQDNGTTYIGKDAAGNTGSSKLAFTNSAGARTEIQASDDFAALSAVQISTETIIGTGKTSSRIDDLIITSNIDVQVGQLTMGAGNSISVGNNNVTLTDVVIDLSGLNYNKQSMGENGGTCYVYDLSNMINCALTMNKVQFMVDGTEELSGYTATKDAIAFYFGDDVNILNAQSVTLAISGSSAPQYLDSKSGAVYFGENVTPPDIDVPEPATGILALVGLAGLAGRRRRK